MRDDLDEKQGATFQPTKANQRPEDRITFLSSAMFGDVLKAENAARKASDLDKPAVRDLWMRVKSHYLRELDRQAEWRREMELDGAFYDGDQWNPEDIAILVGRGQEPLVFNIIAQSVDWIIGTERRGRTKHKILPRTKNTSKQAQAKSDYFSYLDDVNMSDFHWSRAFSDAVKFGVGWMESGIQDDDAAEPIFEESDSWRNIIFDSSAPLHDFDLHKSRYQFKTLWADADDAMALFPDRITTIKEACYAADEFGHSMDRMGDEAMDSREEEMQSEGYSNLDSPTFSRDRVRLIEAWFRIPDPKSLKLRGGTFSGELFDPSSPGHAAELDAGQAEIVERLTYQMYVMIFTTTGPLFFARSPYRHNRYPRTPIWGFRKDKDGSPYGIIRRMRDAQRDVNKRLSKAQFILNSQKTIMEKGAVDDVDEYLEEAARPDSVIELNPGKRFEIAVDRELSEAHLGLMQVSMQMIQSLSGVTDESLGRTTNATSGKAIIARQEQGALSTTHLFDNTRMARAFHGEKKLSLIEQFVTERKEFRITDARNNPKWVTVNDDTLPDSDIARSKADFVIAETDWNATARQAQMEALLNVVVQLAAAAPQLALVMLDLIIDAMDIPNREEIVKRVRAISGAEDPDADPENPTPEALAQQEAKAEAAAMQKRAAEAEIAKLEGEGALKQHQAAKAKADAEKVIRSLPTDTLNNFANALQIAIQMLTAAGAVDTADALLAAAETISQPDQAPAPMAAAPVPTGPAPMPPGPPQPAPMMA